MDSTGNAYVVGNTMSARWEKPIPADFPISEKSFFKERQSGRQGFLVKLDPNGKTLFSMLLPTNNATDLALDRLGNIYITGEYLLESYSTVDAFQSNSRGGGNEHYAGEAFVMKIDKTGTRLLWATHLGGQ